MDLQELQECISQLYGDIAAEERRRDTQDLLIVIGAICVIAIVGLVASLIK